ncbi:MAG: hypothetical protein KDD38_08815, partial [Bdellovibrionales bacterium]|nr:hypothetical protein [Bdellovibrionales bacterium]
KDLTRNKIGFNPESLSKILNHTNILKNKTGKNRLVSSVANFLELSKKQNPYYNITSDNIYILFLISVVLFEEVKETDRSSEIREAHRLAREQAMRLGEDPPAAIQLDANYLQAQKLTENMMATLASEIIDKLNNYAIGHIITQFKKGLYDLGKARTLIAKSVPKSERLAITNLYDVVKLTRKEFPKFDILALSQSPLATIERAFRAHHPTNSQFINSSGLHFTYIMMTADKKNLATEEADCKTLIQ